METLEITFKLNALEFSVKGSRDDVKEQFNDFKSLLKDMGSKFQPGLVTEILTPDQIGEGEKNEDREWPSLKQIVMSNLPTSEVEWIVIYAFYASGFGTKEFIQNDISQKLKESGRDSKSRKKNLSRTIVDTVSHRFIVAKNDTEFILSSEGKAKAIEIIQRDSSTKKNNLKPSRAQASTGNKKEARTVTSLKLLGDLNLAPDGHKSLKDFYSGFQVSSDMERNVLFTYYLSKKINVPKVSYNHIYTSYKNVGARVPENLLQSLKNTKFNKGWIDTKHFDDIKITVTGENFVEIDLLKKGHS